MKITTVPAFLCLLTAGLQAGPLIGPNFPPPGGVTFTSSGSSGLIPGKTFNYSNFDSTQYDLLYWGPTTVQIGISSLNSMAFTSCNGNTCEFDDSSDWYTPTRMLLTVSGLGAEDTEANLGASTAPTYPLFQVTGDFSATFVFESFFRGNWVGIDSLSNEDLGTGGGQTNVKSAGYGFFSTEATPEPASGILLIGSLALLAFFRLRNRLS